MTDETNGAEELVNETESEANELNNELKENEEDHEEAVADESNSDGSVEKVNDEPDWLKKRIDKEVAKRKRLEEELASIRKRESEAYFSQAQQVDPDTGIQLVKPRTEDYEDWRDYENARVEYEEKARRADLLVQQKKREAQTYETLNSKLEQKKKLARKKYDDFDEVESIVTNDAFPVSQAMADVILSSDNSADLLYYLGKNPNEAKRLYDLPPIVAAKEMGKIESQFAQPRKVSSSAPKPIKVEGKSSIVSKNLENMSDAEFEAYLGLR